MTYKKKDYIIPMCSINEKAKENKKTPQKIKDQPSYGIPEIP